MADDANNPTPDDVLDAPETTGEQPDINDNPTDQNADDDGNQPETPPAAEDDDGDGNDDEGDPDPDDPDGKEKTDEDNPEDPKDKARREHAERQARKTSMLDERSQAVAEKERKFQAELDPNDPEYRLKILESKDRAREAEALVSTVRANQQALRNDAIAVQQIPYFKDKPQALKSAQDEFARLYLVESEEKNPEDREILGAFDPRTGKPVSFYEFMLTKAEEYGAIGESAEASGRKKERQMRGNADPSGSAARRTTETKFENMSPKDQAAYLRAKGHDF